jgi:hypothetical protein
MNHGAIASFGKYTVDEDKKAFSVRFEGSTFPNNEGAEQQKHRPAGQRRRLGFAPRIR